MEFLTITGTTLQKAYIKKEWVSKAFKLKALVNKMIIIKLVVNLVLALSERTKTYLEK